LKSALPRKQTCAAAQDISAGDQKPWVSEKSGIFAGPSFK
jgi:hypothetical protein